MLMEIFHEISSEEDAGLNLVGHEQHLVGKYEIAEQDYQRQENDDKNHRREKTRTFQIERRRAVLYR